MPACTGGKDYSVDAGGIAGACLMENNMKKTCLILAALLVNAGAFGVSLAAAVPDEIETRTLDNGLKIIVWPDHDIPNVVMYNFVRAGGRNEYPGTHCNNSA